MSESSETFRLFYLYVYGLWTIIIGTLDIFIIFIWTTNKDTFNTNLLFTLNI